MRIKRYLLVLLFLALHSVIAAREAISLGMTEVELRRLHSHRIAKVDPLGGLTLNLPFFEHEATVYVGFSHGRVHMITASFETFSENTDPLVVIRDIRKRLESLSGEAYYFVRINGVDVLGESGGKTSDGGKGGVIVYGTTRDKILYQLKVSASEIVDFSHPREIVLTVVAEEATRPPD